MRKYGLPVYYRFLLCFQTMPIGALVHTDYGTMLALHGGLSPKIARLEQLEELDRFVEPEEEQSLLEVLWSDPIQIREKRGGEGADAEQSDTDASDNEADGGGDGGRGRGGAAASAAAGGGCCPPCDLDKLVLQRWRTNPVRGCSYLFGFGACVSFLDRNCLLCLLRAHEVQEVGFKVRATPPTIARARDISRRAPDATRATGFDASGGSGVARSLSDRAGALRRSRAHGRAPPLGAQAPPPPARRAARAGRRGRARARRARPAGRVGVVAARGGVDVVAALAALGRGRAGQRRGRHARARHARARRAARERARRGRRRGRGAAHRALRAAARDDGLLGPKLLRPLRQQGGDGARRRARARARSRGRVGDDAEALSPS